MKSKTVIIKDLYHLGSSLKELEYLDELIIDFTEVEEWELNKYKNFLAGFIFGTGVSSKDVDKDKVLLNSIDKNFTYDIVTTEGDECNIIFGSKEETFPVAKDYLDGKAITFDVSRLAKNDAKYVFDTLSGVAFGLNGNLEKIEENVFKITPVVACITEESDNNAACCIKQANLLYNSGEKETAINLLKKYLLEHKDYEDELYMVATKLLAAILNLNNKPAEAEAIIKKSLKNIPKKESSRLLIFLELELVKAYELQGIFHKAEKLIEKVVAEGKTGLDELDIKYKLARTYCSAGKYKKAIPLVYELIECYDREEGVGKEKALVVLNDMLYKMYYKPKDLPKRIEAMKNIIAHEKNIKGENEYIALNICDLGSMHLDLKQYEAAKLAFEESEKMLKNLDDGSDKYSKYMQYLKNSLSKLPKGI